MGSGGDIAETVDKGFFSADEEPSSALNAAAVDASEELMMALGALSLRVEMLLYPPLKPLCTASPAAAGPPAPPRASARSEERAFIYKDCFWVPEPGT